MARRLQHTGIGDLKPGPSGHSMLLHCVLVCGLHVRLSARKYAHQLCWAGCWLPQVGDRLERLGQLLVAAEDYEPGCLAGLSPSDDEEEQQQAGAPGTAAAAGAAPGSRARASSVQQGPAGSTRSGSASSSSGGANGGRGSRAHNLFVARTFLDEVALFSSSESGVGAKGVRLMTVHASKGLEFEAVFVAGGQLGRARGPYCAPSGCSVAGLSSWVLVGVKGRQACCMVAELPGASAGPTAGCNEGRLPLLHKDSPDSDATVSGGGRQEGT